MPTEAPFDRSDLLGFVPAGVVALLSLRQVVESGSIPLATIAGLALLTAVVGGPAAWLVRDRTSEQWQDRVGFVGILFLFLAGQIGLGLALVFGVPFVSSFHGAIVGIFVGLVLVVIAEQTVVPAELSSQN